MFLCWASWFCKIYQRCLLLVANNNIIITTFIVIAVSQVAASTNSYSISDLQVDQNQQFLKFALRSLFHGEVGSDVIIVDRTSTLHRTLLKNSGVTGDSLISFVGSLDVNMNANVSWQDEGHEKSLNYVLVISQEIHMSDQELNKWFNQMQKYTGTIWKPKIFILLIPDPSTTREKEEQQEPCNDHLLEKVILKLFGRENLENCTLESDLYVLPSLGITCDCERCLLGDTQRSLEDSRIFMYEMFFLRGKTLIHQPVASVGHLNRNLTSNFSYLTEILRKGQRRRNFQRMEVYGISQEDIASNETQDEHFKSQFEDEIFLYLSDALNFTPVTSKGQEWVSVDENGVLFGMGADIDIGLADIAISPSTFLLNRAKLLQFLHPTYFSEIWIYFRQPPTREIHDIYLQAFQDDLWCLLFLTCLSLLASLKLLGFIKASFKSLHEKDKNIVQEAIIWMSGAICQQGWHIYPESVSMKIIFVSGLLMSLLVYISYSATLYSLLSIVIVPVQSYADILRFKFSIVHDHEILSEDYLQDLEAAGIIPLTPKEIRHVPTKDSLREVVKFKKAFMSLNDQFYPRIRSQFRIYSNVKANTSTTNLGNPNSSNNNNIASLSSLIANSQFFSSQRRVNEETYVCHRVSKVRLSSKPILSGMFLKKGSQFKELFNYKILKMYDTGLRNRFINNYVRQTSLMCPNKDKNTSREPFTIYDVLTAFIALAIGASLSMAILFAEKLILSNSKGFTDRHERERQWLGEKVIINATKQSIYVN